MSPPLETDDIVRVANEIGTNVDAPIVTGNLMV